jgi:hypothetical protein
MTRDEWLQQFEDELKKLRPHLTDKVAYTLALQAYDGKEHPRVAAREYHKRQQPPAPAPARKRAK